MKKKSIIVLMILSLGFNAGVVVTVCHNWLRHRAFVRSPQMEGERHKKYMQKMLQLSDAQAQTMHNDWETMQKAITPVKQELEAKRAALFTLIDSGTADTATIDRAVGEIVPLQMQLEKTIIEHSLAFSRTLTPQQRIRFKSLFQKGAKRLPRGQGFLSGKLDF
ncbi:MAG: periplasmic heavy metal sensor [Endomicrobiales bacterium]|jgi:Spy/CpxP family protein refolding chaperone